MRTFAQNEWKVIINEISDGIISEHSNTFEHVHSETANQR